MKNAVFNGLCQHKSIEIVEHLHEDLKKLFNYLCALDNKHARIYVSQGRLAQLIGYSTKTVRKYLKLLMALGFIYYENRGAWRTCLYYINPLFYQYDLRVQLQPVFSSFHRVAAGLLRSTLQSVISVLPTISYSYLNTGKDKPRRTAKNKNTAKYRATYTMDASEWCLFDNLAAIMHHTTQISHVPVRCRILS